MISIAALWLVAPVAFILTRNPLTQPWNLVMAMLALLWLIADWNLFSTTGSPENLAQRRMWDVIIFTLFLVGATQWFFSPFFWTLYLLIIAVTFVFSPAGGLGFVISLVALFVFNVGEVDVAYDSLILLSLLITMPIALYLRREYLKLQEGQKKILVLEKKAAESGSTVDQLLANVVTFTSAELRQPLVNIKNYSHVLINKKMPVKKAYEYLTRVYQSSVVAIGMVNRFDEQSTGRKIK